MRGSTYCHRTRAFLCVGPTDSTQDRISSCPHSNLWPTYLPSPPWCFCVQIGHRHALMTREILCARFQCPAKCRSWLRTCGALTHTLSTCGRRRVTQRFPPALSEAFLPLLPLPPSPVFVWSFPFFIFAKNGRGKVDCLCACEDRASSPTLNVFVNFQTLSTIINRPSSINSWLIARWSHQQLVDK